MIVSLPHSFGQNGASSEQASESTASRSNHHQYMLYWKETDRWTSLRKEMGVKEQEQMRGKRQNRGKSSSGVRRVNTIRNICRRARLQMQRHPNSSSIQFHNMTCCTRVQTFTESQRQADAISSTKPTNPIFAIYTQAIEFLHEPAKCQI